LRQKDYAAAGADFSRVIELNPDVEEAWVNRALARLAQARYSQAIDDLDQSLERGARPVRIYFIRARVRQKAGDVEGARDDLVEGMKRPPEDEQSWVARGVALAARDPRGALSDSSHHKATAP
jgi:tetratricopeptide (TPR) repeat protein